MNSADTGISNVAFYNRNVSSNGIGWKNLKKHIRPGKIFFICCPEAAVKEKSVHNHNNPYLH